MRHLRRTLVATATALAATAFPALSATADTGTTSGPLPPGLTGAGYLQLHARDFAPFCDLEPDGEPRADTRTLAMDLKRLPGLEESYRAELAIEGEVQLGVDEEGGDSLYWIGEAEGDPTSFVFIAVDGACTETAADDDITGTAETKDREYLFGSDPEDPERTEVVDFEPERLPAPAVPPLKLPNTLPKAPATSPKVQTPTGEARAGKKAVIDVVIGYTPLAEQGLKDGTNSQERMLWGKSFPWQPREIGDTIKAAELQMNRAFKTSGVNAEVNVVHSFEVKGYKGTEDPSVLQEDMEAGRGELGKLAHKVREQYGADLVSFWTNVPKAIGTPFTAGQGSLSSTKLSKGTNGLAYSTIDVFTATGRDPGFAHELGHNLALWHDPITLEQQIKQAAKENNLSEAEVRKQMVPPYPGSQGWITPDGKFFTTMAYRITCEAKFGEGKGKCEYAGAYSNPKVIAKDKKDPLGTGGTSNAAAVLKQTAPVVADYRKAAAAKLVTRVAPVAKAGKVAASPKAPYTKGTQVTLTAAPSKYWAPRSWLVGTARQAAKGNRTVVTLPAGTQTVTAEFGCRMRTAGGTLGKAWAKAGAEKKKLGCPTGAPVRAKNKDFSQRFEGGTIAWVAKTGKVVVR
ncbi:zinc-dependent metalloprotease family protein [Streptomyces sp. NPDC041068]|uniref:zinc-dependent metalloprotease family protein n=1 Tax=Streptomyces sp. NPDC041068 TaxID=3155130 RepID=UPI0033FB1240